MKINSIITAKLQTDPELFGCLWLKWNKDILKALKSQGKKGEEKKVNKKTCVCVV